MDVNFDWNDNRVLKGVLAFLAILLVVILIKFSQIKKENNHLQDAYEQKLQKEIAAKEKVIESYKEQIADSKKVIADLEIKQTQYEHSLDSLSTLKQRVKTIYKDRIIELQTFHSSDIEDYWRNKFRIDE
jgi:chromosome segregation ATPase